MTLPSSGPLSLADIQAEFGGSNPISLSEYYGVASGVPSSGTISISNFYGTSSATPISATGGTISTGGGYRYHRFTGSGTFTVNSIATGGASNTLEIFMAGGGAGSTSFGCGSGGGGACAIRTVSATVGNKTVTVGGGGAYKTTATLVSATGNPGGSSGFTGVSSVSGGLGGYNRYFPPTHQGGNSGSGKTGGAGRSNGDGWSTGAGGSATTNGAAGSSSFTPITGTAGYTLSGWTASTSRTQYGGSGGGSARDYPSVLMSGAPGAYGGGYGATSETSTGGSTNGAANSGGSGGAGGLQGAGGSGGSGIVIIRYQI